MAEKPWLFWLIIVLMLWSLPWKGMALWRAAKNDKLHWFVILLLVNTVAILDILFLVFFSEEKKEKTFPLPNFKPDTKNPTTRV